MKKYTFKDGFKCVASTREEAIAQHKAIAAKGLKRTLKHASTLNSCKVEYKVDFPKDCDYLSVNIVSPDNKELLEALFEKYDSEEGPYWGLRIMNDDFNELFLSNQVEDNPITTWNFKFRNTMYSIKLVK